MSGLLALETEFLSYDGFLVLTLSILIFGINSHRNGGRIERRLGGKKKIEIHFFFLTLNVSSKAGCLGSIGI